MHYYNFNIADYRKDTGHLSTLEHGIYRQLIDWYYLDETPIPKETQVVMRRLRLGSDELHLLQNVLQDFFNLTDNGYVHKRIEEELINYQTQFAKNRVNGMLGGRPKKTQVVSENNHMATQSEPKITLTNNHKPITNNHKPIKDISTKKPFVLPDWVNKKHWDIWHSKGKRKSASIEQKELAIEKLERWKNSGMDYVQALHDAAEGGWQGLHEPKFIEGKSSVISHKKPNRMNISEIDHSKDAEIWGAQA